MDDSIAWILFFLLELGMSFTLWWRHWLWLMIDWLFVLGQGITADISLLVGLDSWLDWFIDWLYSARRYSRHLPLGGAWLKTSLIMVDWLWSPSWWGLTQDFTRLDLIDNDLPLGGARLKASWALIWLIMISLLVGLDSRLHKTWFDWLWSPSWLG